MKTGLLKKFWRNFYPSNRAMVFFDIPESLKDKSDEEIIQTISYMALIEIDNSKTIEKNIINFFIEVSLSDIVENNQKKYKMEISNFRYGLFNRYFEKDCNVVIPAIFEKLSKKDLVIHFSRIKSPEVYYMNVSKIH